jgi:aromatic-L-amino-acid decarboxylase
VYTSSESHSSVAKAALLAGFGAEHLRAIDTDEAYAMIPEALEAAIAADVAAGRRPCAIVASVGTTATTAVDPVARVVEIAARHGAWVHVDAALAGSAMILPECRVHWDGVEGADSIVLNPHKWLGAGFDLSAYYVRDPQHLIRVMGTNPSYLRTAEDGAVSNFRDWHIPLGRRFRALKLWFLIADEGVAGLQARLRRDLDHARWFAAQVDASPTWRRIAPVPFQTVCVTGPDVAHRINESGFAYLTPSVVKGSQILRVSFGSAMTRRADVEALWAELQKW